jgi:glycerophosphoryl diester phosphodiesterase
LEKRIIFSSFNPVTLHRARKAIPEVPQGLLTLPGWKGAFSRSIFNGLIRHEALHPYFTDVTEAMIRRQHERGIRVHPWTIDPPEEIERLLRMNADGVITDDPVLARQVLNKIQAQN